VDACPGTSCKFLQAESPDTRPTRVASPTR
jgi:hypothetical protein